jgi:hypothetical protein
MTVWRDLLPFCEKCRGSRRPIVMVLGMHRSGTSLCSHVLSALGLDMTDHVSGPGLDTPGEDNPFGHWERWEIVEYHDRILRFFNRGLFSPGHDFAFPMAWWADPRVAEVRREITAFLEGRMGIDYFGFRDPRTVRLMPMWHQIINELKLAPKIIFCLRNPAQVARSLNQRDGFSLDTGEYRWFSYTADFFRYTQSAEFCTIEYESWFEDPALNLAKLRNFLDMPEDLSELDLDFAVAQLVRHDLRHDDPRIGEARQSLIRSVYKLARLADHDTAARGEAQKISAQFVTFQRLHAWLHREFEQAAAGAAELRVQEQVATEAEEMAGLREALATAERRAQGAEAVPEIRAELTRLSDALARAQQEVWERTELIETMRAETLFLGQERVAIIASMEAESSGCATLWREANASCSNAKRPRWGYRMMSRRCARRSSAPNRRPMSVPPISPGWRPNSAGYVKR